MSKSILVIDTPKCCGISELLDYIINNMHWCPFRDEANIDFEKECVGFGESGCRECILRNIKQLK